MTPGLCENCHKRPKYGTHRFCGKTCAAQGVAKPTRSSQYPQPKGGPRNAGQQRAAPIAQKTAQLCTHCGQKPKFNGFDYCGKSCAAIASAAPIKQPTTPGLSTTKQKAGRTPNAPPNTIQVPPPAKPHKAPRTKVPVPLDDSSEEEPEPDDDGDDDGGGVSTDLDAYPSDSESESEDEPSVPAVAQPSAKSGSKGNKLNSSVPKIPPGICAIPGCGQPSHVDRKGVKTMYCSTKHREEAVKQGLEPACIMCQQYPQSTTDYFCSSACRNQSMTKA